MRAFHILIVDDCAADRLLLEAMLKKLGFNNIDQAADGFEGLKLLIRQQYDLIFLDNLMPELSGPEFLRRCKCGSILDWTTVIMMTANADKETLADIQKESLKVDEFILKPINFSTISAKVDRLFRSGKTNPIQQTFQIGEMPDNAVRGNFLSISKESKDNVVTIYLFGFFLNDDRNLIKDLPETIAQVPEQSIILDLTNILMIDETGIGILLLIGSVANMSGKRVGMRIDERTIGKRLIAMHLNRIIPILPPPPPKT
ncbi:MAG: response regulator [Rhodospirillaceae bacterium]